MLDADGTELRATDATAEEEQEEGGNVNVVATLRPGHSTLAKQVQALAATMPSTRQHIALRLAVALDPLDPRVMEAAHAAAHAAEDELRRSGAGGAAALRDLWRSLLMMYAGPAIALLAAPAPGTVAALAKELDELEAHEEALRHARGGRMTP